ncbi:CPBP family intramembrane glutamic endopeptidase [Halosimplex sp. TS25]|uniref:CPBP family intramembrane glutamic endopeptidase n=1 Tax=Halosimplex rarum TaxID=3396619 RepID=UPI0039ECDEEE
MGDDRRSSGAVFAVFLFLAFGWSWAFWGPEALVELGVLDAAPDLPALGAFGPSLAGVAVVAWQRGRSGLRDLARRAVDTSFPRWLWLPTLALFPVVAIVAAAYARYAGATLPTPPWVTDPVALPIAFGYILLLGGPLQEEFGWRGYALDPLVDRAGRLGGSVVLGLLWGFWHLPLFYIPGRTIYYQKAIVGFVASIVMVTIVMTWLYDRTGGSLLAMLLVHTSFNWTTWAIPVLETDPGSIVFLIGQLAVVTAIVAAWRSGRATGRPDRTAE